MRIKKIREQLAARKDTAKTRWQQMEKRMALANEKAGIKTYAQSGTAIKA